MLSLDPEKFFDTTDIIEGANYYKINKRNNINIVTYYSGSGKIIKKISLLEPEPLCMMTINKLKMMLDKNAKLKPSKIVAYTDRYVPITLINCYDEYDKKMVKLDHCPEMIHTDHKYNLKEYLLETNLIDTEWIKNGKIKIVDNRDCL